MKSRSLSSIKNEMALKTNTVFNAKSKMHKFMHCYNASYPIPLASNYDNTFTGITIGGARMYVRTISYASRRHARVATHAIRLDAGCIMSDYKD